MHAAHTVSARLIFCVLAFVALVLSIRVLVVVAILGVLDVLAVLDVVAVLGRSLTWLMRLSCLT